ncbi:MAG: hypothetical protein AAF708_16345, partial [Deinococcota bacterium]
MNYLLGRGEVLTTPVNRASGGGSKSPPYDFVTAKQRVSEKLLNTTQELEQIPDRACPDNKVVAIFTLHPRYISKSDFPEALLRNTSLQALGSLSRRITPERWGVNSHPESALTDDLFVVGDKQSFATWSGQIEDWSEQTQGASQLTHLEDILPFRVERKIRSIPPDQDKAVFEIVLHNGGDSSIVEQYYDYVVDLNAEPVRQRRRDVKGLTFLPVRAEV